jgi:hypothetical protein
MSPFAFHDILNALTEQHRTQFSANLTQSSVAPPNHQREANPGDEILSHQKTA